MKLQNFTLGADGISLEWKNHYLDLHNCYDFKSFSYHLAAQQVILVWAKSCEPEAAGASLPGLQLVFEEVSFLRIKERDATIPFTEDNCLLSVSFHSPELREEFDSISVDYSPADDLTFFFQSEWGFKLQAATAWLGPLPA